MADFQEQLAYLRLRIAAVESRWRDAPPRKREPVERLDEHERVERLDVRERLDEILGGAVVEYPPGRYWERETCYSRLGRHGAVEMSTFEELPAGLLGPISEGRIPECDPRRWAFLDTETTGLSGGTGTCPFLAGVGRIAADGFRVRQFFMRDYDEEPAMLAALAAHLAEFDVVITYNGASFDLPLLETRYRLARRRTPFEALQHLDLLVGARRLWKLRLESCRLADLESRILGHEREDDIAGSLIPYVWFEFLRTGRALRLAAVFRHNATDIVSLAALAGIVCRAFGDPEGDDTLHAPEMAGLARWLQRSGRPEEALRLYRRAVARGLDDELLFRTLWDVALLEKKLGRMDQAIPVFDDLAGARNPFQSLALEELAKHSEHRERDPARALGFTEAALGIVDCPELRRRQARLLRRIGAGGDARVALGVARRGGAVRVRGVARRAADLLQRGAHGRRRVADDGRLKDAQNI